MTEFGGMISTSNELDGDECIVTTDKPVLWTIEFRRHFNETEKGSSSSLGGEGYHLKRIRCTEV